MLQELRVETIQFKRKEDTPFELGIIINEGNGPIIDMKGKVVKGNVWNYHYIRDHVMTVTAFMQEKD